LLGYAERPRTERPEGLGLFAVLPTGGRIVDAHALSGWHGELWLGGHGGLHFRGGFCLRDRLFLAGVA